ncbi:polysaccharide biosynthesis tyrosine autokinase [Propioniciclava soli]|uniref:polysaccharide biosynthesis tyrosine autokinase n=1 Tax=Propioniciclava soli TaxID=2775081 RepID=UPI001E548664|nr:polysaccharide biosynthesis tyrosine autokinase [Propioniciclava soli]
MLKHANLSTIKHHWLLVTVLTLLGGLVAFGLSSLMTPQYRSSASLYFTLNFGNTASDLAQGSTYTSNQMTSFGELASSPVVLQPVIDRLQLPMSTEQLGRVVNISTPRETVIMDVAVATADPQRSAEIANAIAAQAKTVIEEYAPRTREGASTVTVRTIKEATPPTYQFAPDKRTNTALGLFAGLLAGVLAAISIATLDNKVRGEASLAETGKVTFLGSLRSRSGKGGGHEATVLQEPTGSAAEEYRQLRSSLRYVTLSKQPLALVVSSATPGEGKSTVAVNLAAVIAESSRSVLLIDADLRRPRVASYAQIDGSVGVTDVLVGQAELSDTIQPLGDSGVDILPAGGSAPNPAELLSSPQMAEILDYGRQHYDAVIIDTAPVLVVADALALTTITDGIVLVARVDKTRKRDLQVALETTQGAGANVLGVVLNGARARQTDRDRYYDYKPAIAPASSAEPAVS